MRVSAYAGGRMLHSELVQVMREGRIVVRNLRREFMTEKTDRILSHVQE